MDPVTASAVKGKLTEQFDKYFLGIATFFAIFCLGVARIARSTTTDETTSESRPLSARLGPVSHVALNTLAPGLGLALLRGWRRMLIGLALLIATLGIVGTRIALRHAHGIEYSFLAFTRDGAIWIGIALLSALLTVWEMSRDGAVRYVALDRLRANPAPWFAIANMVLRLRSAHRSPSDSFPTTSSLLSDRNTS